MRSPRAVTLCAALAVAAVTGCSSDDDTTGATASSAGAAPVTSATTGPPAESGVATASTAPAPPTEPSAPPIVASTAAPVPVPSGADPVVALTEVGSFADPVDLTWRDGDDALYVVEQGGTIQRVAADTSITALDLSDLTDGGGERGLLGLAFAPAGDFAYVNYTDLDGRTTITEFPVDADGTFRTGDEARTLLVIDQPYANHNGGGVEFGPDGMLYIGMGDGGSGGDPERRATNPAELLGKLLRIDPTPSGDQPYTVPADNPYVGQAGYAPEIWASGLRNPWRFSFDAATGDLWIGDVGQNAVEEIDVVAAVDGRDAGRGANFGWSAFEGDQPYNADVQVVDPVPPFSTYTHADGGCSISGGVRVRGPQVPDLVGWYVYGDYCTGQVWALEVIDEGGTLTAGRQVDLGPLTSITAVVAGPAGEVYALSKRGPVVRLDPAS